MSQPSQSIYKKAVNHRTKVYDSARKSDLVPKLNDASSIISQVNHETSSTSSSSTTDSSVSEYVVNPSPTIPNAKTRSQKPIVTTVEIRSKPILIPPNDLDDDNDDEEPLYANHKSSILEDRIDPRRNSFRVIKFRDEIESNPAYVKSPSRIQNKHQASDADSIGLEIEPQRSAFVANGYPHRSLMNENYESADLRERSTTMSHRTPPPVPPPPAFAKPYLSNEHRISPEDQQPYQPKRTLPLATYMMELGALLVVFIICMVLVLALHQDETNLQTTMQIVYSYIYVVSIVWMIWCTIDIIKFRRQWLDLTSDAHDNDEYMDITERHPHVMFYFPDRHNTGGLFMRVGAGLLCMGGLLLTLIEIVKTIVSIGTDDTSPAHRAAPSGVYSTSVLVTKIITYLFRFLFHCVQFSFLFRYGNIVINRYHLVARIGLIHLIIANFCTWFEAIIIETLAQVNKNPNIPSKNETTSTTTISPGNDSEEVAQFLKNLLVAAAAAAPSDSDSSTTGKNRTILEILNQLESTMGVYLYPCLIEYSLISLTVFFIMWRNIGNVEKRSLLRFGDRHVFTVNCSRASRGLLIGGILFLLTILTLIPTYIFEDDATRVSHISGLVLLVVSLFTVCLSAFQTTTLFYDEHAHVDSFDQVLILLTTVGDFAYSFFGLFAEIFVVQSQSQLPAGVEILTTVLAICQTFVQTGFIMDTLKRRTKTKQENRIKPGRETITALLLMNLAIWMHDSLSAKKVQSNPTQVAYYNEGTWAIIQAFTAPLSIFYRFHSSVCLADIWQEVYHDQDGNHRSGGKSRLIPLTTMNGAFDSQH